MTKNELIALRYLAEKGNHYIAPKELTDNQYKAALLSLNKKGLATVSFLIGNDISTANISIQGRAALDDISAENITRKMKEQLSNEEIKVLEYLSDGEEHFEEADIEDYYEICEYLSEKGYVDLGETKDDGIKLTYRGKKVLREIKIKEGNLTNLEFTILNVIRLHEKEINPENKNSPQIYDYVELSLFTKEEITKCSKEMMNKGWIRCFIDDGPAYWHRLTSTGRIALRTYIESHPKLGFENANNRIEHIMSNKVFIVHGHDDDMKSSVARVLEKLNIEPIILSEQPNQGRTIIEKFEDESNVDYAVVLLSDKDDHGSEITSNQLKPRARQNVILELGYFIGKLGRNRVFVLKKNDVEIPSDILGVVYTEYDNNEGWKYSLCKELRELGYSVDMNKI